MWWTPNISLTFFLVFIISVLQIPETNVLTGKLCTLKKCFSFWFIWFSCFIVVTGFSSFFWVIKNLLSFFCTDLFEIGIDFQVIISSYTINVPIFACTYLHKNLRFHEFFSESAKIDIWEIIHSPWFVKINTCIKKWKSFMTKVTKTISICLWIKVSTR